MGSMMNTLRHMFIPEVDEEERAKLKQREEAAEEAAHNCLGRMKQLRLQFDTRESAAPEPEPDAA